MNNLVSNLAIIAPIFFLIFVGISLRKSGGMTAEGNATLKKIVVDIMLPCLLIKTFMSAEYTISVLLIVVLIYCLFTAMIFAFGKIVPSHPMLKFIVTSFEVGMMGLVMFPLIFPASTAVEISRIGILDIGQSLFIFTVYCILADTQTKQTPKAVLVKIVTTRTVIALVIGVIFGIIGFADLCPNANTVLQAVCDMATAPIGAIVLISVGFELKFTKSTMKKALCYACIRFVVMALAGIFVYYVIGLFAVREEYAMQILVLFTLPPTFLMPMLQKNEEDRELCATTLSISILIFLACAISYIAFL
ncbi:MAG: AEC family transporter [Bacillota bacterium]